MDIGLLPVGALINNAAGNISVHFGCLVVSFQLGMYLGLGSGSQKMHSDFYILHL